MSLTLRFLLSLGALVIGGGILGISLFYGSSQSFSASEGVLSRKEFGLNQEILPDHVLYPALMAIDRIKLESAPVLEQIYLKTEYANRRYDYTQELLKKEKTDLAYSTLSKSEKYLLYAGSDLLAYPDAPENTVKHVIKTLEYHQTKHKEVASHFNDAQRAEIDSFLQQSQVMLDQLKTR